MKAHKSLQDLETCLEESRAELKASQRTLRAAEEATQEQNARNEHLANALEEKANSLADMQRRHEQLALDAQTSLAESCRSVHVSP